MLHWVKLQKLIVIGSNKLKKDLFWWFRFNFSHLLNTESCASSQIINWENYSSDICIYMLWYITMRNQGWKRRYRVIMMQSHSTNLHWQAITPSQWSVERGTVRKTSSAVIVSLLLTVLAHPALFVLVKSHNWVKQTKIKPPSWFQLCRLSHTFSNTGILHQDQIWLLKPLRGICGGTYTTCYHRFFFVLGVF